MIGGAAFLAFTASAFFPSPAGYFLAVAFLAAALLVVFSAGLAGAALTTFFAVFFSGVDVAALTAAQRFLCAAAMRFLASGLNLRRFGGSLVVAFPAGAFFFAFAGEDLPALTAAHRFL